MIDRLFQRAGSVPRSSGRSRDMSTFPPLGVRTASFLAARRTGAAEPTEIESAPKRVGFVLVSGFAMLGYAAAIDFLRAANAAKGQNIYSWSNVALNGRPAMASSGIEIACTHNIGTSLQFDYIFVIASDEGLDFDDPALFAWLRKQASHGTVVGGISGGVFLLARAGLLKGRRATIHWIYAAAFSEEFPEIDLRPTLFEIDGPLMSCSGGVAVIDLMHRIFSEDHSGAFADSVSEWFLHSDVRDGEMHQGQSYDHDRALDPTILRALMAMNASLEHLLSRQALAATAQVSVRQLDRLFLAQLGESAKSCYLRLRLAHARRLVLQSNMPHLEIAHACGFSSASSFSKSYRAAYGLPPTADRAGVVRQGIDPDQRA